MFAPAVQWATLASLGTALGTLVLAIATFVAVQASKRSTRLSEIALEERRRPVLTHSRLNDPPQKLRFIDGHWVTAEGGRASVAQIDGSVYLAISLRNVGAGMAVCQAWAVAPSYDRSEEAHRHRPLEAFRTQARDIYVPAGDIGMWQGALRGPDDEDRVRLVEAIDNGEAISIELLYSDLVGNQRTISRFGLLPGAEDGEWYASMSRHWHLDQDGPRREEHTLEASREIIDHVAESGRVDPRDMVQ
ncbi:hypothetical protein [Conexibacter sp. DBS9H8]|uniref:hypothetical protein n=1 Tax=Conexibacter sp. DBS9H8 TaxID=2937801 RepID=UPI00200BD71E|nr:hypothetical protein [Conexibacter sp. DBS9H8]